MAPNDSKIPESASGSLVKTFETAKSVAIVDAQNVAAEIEKHSHASIIGIEVKKVKYIFSY